MKTIILAIAICVVGGGSLIGQTTESSYPGLPFGNVKIGMSKEALQTLDKEMKFVEMSNHRATSMLRQGEQNFMFYLKDGKVLQVSYGWEGLKEEAQKAKTQQLLNEFAARYGDPVRFERTRLIASGPATIAARKYAVSPSDVAVIESWDGTISIIVTTAEQWAEAERKANAYLQRSQNKNQMNGDAQRPGVVDLLKKKPGTLKKSVSQPLPPKAPKDFISEVDKEH